MSRYSVIVSQRADEMLITHARFLAQVSVSAAKRMTDEFEKILDTLENNPYQFPAETDYAIRPAIARPCSANGIKRFSPWMKGKKRSIWMLFWIADKTGHRRSSADTCGVDGIFHVRCRYLFSF